MTRLKRDKNLEKELEAMLAPNFSGITIEAAHSDRWQRMCATFRWSGFASLLPEERFHRLVGAIPAEFREARLAGFVWVELAPDEDIDAFLKLPRSEDIANEEATIYAGLSEVRFFAALANMMGRAPGKKCGGDFERVQFVLSAKGYSPGRIRDAKLVFIHQGTYCDCQVLQTAEAELAKLYADVA